MSKQLLVTIHHGQIHKTAHNNVKVLNVRTVFMYSCITCHVLFLAKMAAGVHFMPVPKFTYYLSLTFDGDLVDVIKKNKISGSIFLKLT